MADITLTAATTLALVVPVGNDARASVTHVPRPILGGRRRVAHRAFLIGHAAGAEINKFPPPGGPRVFAREPSEFAFPTGKYTFAEFNKAGLFET